MKILYICIGNELLRGTTINKNLATIGAKILNYNVQLSRQITINDNFHEIKNAIKRNLRKYDVIITTGGLGPTSDDITKDALADAVNSPLVQSLDVKKSLEVLWKKRGYGKLANNQLKQSYFPKGSTILENKNGSAPGCQVNYKSDNHKCAIFVFPGPPHEMIPMLDQYLLPYIANSLQNENICNCYYVSDLPESTAEIAVENILKENNLKKFIDVAYCAEPRLIKIFFTVAKVHEDKLIAAEQIFTELFSEQILNINATSLAEDIITLAASDDYKFTLATAESCTGGLIGGAFTKVSGASEVYQGGIIAYSNEVKQNILKVKKETLDQFGAVSEEVAIEMVENCKNIFSTDCAISVTGIAGPNGGTAEKPVGLVYIAIRVKSELYVKKYNFRGNRENIRWQTIQNSLADLRSIIKQQTVKKS